MVGHMHPLWRQAVMWWKVGTLQFWQDLQSKPDSEVAIKGFNFKVLTPKGETQELTLSHSKALSLADVKTDQAGTYTVTGLRTGELKYAKVGQRWLRVLDAKAEDLVPLAERHFMTPSEVQAKTQQFTVQRVDQLLSYFSKQKQSEVKQERVQQGLRLEFSGHPNQISLKHHLE